MKSQRKSIILLIAVLAIFTMSCTLINAISSSAEQMIADVVEDAAQSIIDEVDVVADNQLGEQAEEVPTPTAEQQPVEQPVEEPISANWLVGIGSTSLTYFSETDMSPVTLSVNGYVVTAVPSPTGGKVAIIRSEMEYETGALWLDLLDLNTGVLTTITPLSNSDTVMENFETVEICQPPREANFATTYSEPVWTPDGSTVVFISAHEGLYAAPYAYNVNTASMYDLMLGGESHYYYPVMSPDGQYIVVPSATCFGTGAGLSMESFNFARVNGNEAALLQDVTDVTSLITWGWLDNRTVVFSLGDMMASAKNLQAMDILTGEIIAEITGPFDYVSNVAVATGQDALMFTTHMSDIYEYIDGENITNDALYYWNRNASAYTQLNDQVVWGSTVQWNDAMQCFYASLSSGGDEADTVLAYAIDGSPNAACQPQNTMDGNIPAFDASQQYFAWNFYNWDQPELSAFNVQGFTDSAKTQIRGSSVTFAWHPSKTILTYMDESSLYFVTPPDFMSNEVLKSPENLINFFWVTP